MKTSKFKYYIQTMFKQKETKKDIKKFVHDINDELSLIDPNFEWVKLKDSGQPENDQKKLKVQEMQKILEEIKHINKELKDIDPNFLWLKILKKHRKDRKFKRENIFVIVRRVFMVCISLTVLLVGLDLLKRSIISGINIEFFKDFFAYPVKSFFLSYLMTEVTMSGSPIAWAFISLGDVLSINQNNLVAIIMWTRGGINSFLLITGILMLIKWKSLKRALWISVIQFFVTLSSTLISAIFVFHILKLDFMETLSQKVLDWFILSSVFDVVVKFFSDKIIFVVSNNIITWIWGILLLVGGLFLFDRSFSFIAHWKDRKILKKIANEKNSFIAGFILTALTMSLSVSVAIMMPLYVRKAINKKMLIAYILGANVSTLFDTLFLWIMSQSAIGIKVILSFIISIAISVAILFALFKYYQNWISKATDYVLENKYRFIVFTIISMLGPIAFIFL